MADSAIPPPPPGFTLDAPAQGPVYGAPPSPAAQYQAPQAQANLTRTQQEIRQAEATAAATTQKTNAEAQSAEIAAKTASEQYAQAHVAESPALLGLTGPALLAKLPPDEAPMIKAMIEGRMAPPTASALKDPQWQQRLKWANQVDPDFNEARWQMRVKTMADAATGRIAQANNAINTAIGHAGLLMDQAGNPGVAGHGEWPLIPDIVPTAVNAIQNYAEKGSPALSAYNDTAQKLGTEEARAYQGGAPNEGDTNRYVASLSANLPFDAKKAVIHNALELFASKTVANLAQYDFGTMGGKPPLDVLDKPALDTLQKYAPDVLQKYFYPHFIGAQGGGPPPPDGTPPGIGGGTGGGQPNGGQPNPPPDQVAPATGRTKEVYDASLTPVRREYMARLEQGQSATQLVSFLRQAGASMNPAVAQSIAQQVTFRRQHPDIPINQYDTSAIDHHLQQMGIVNRAVNAVGQTSLGAGGIAAGNAVLGGFGPDIIGALGGNKEQAQLAGQYSAQDHPGAALTGSIVGGTAAALAGEGALGAAGMDAGVGRSLIADSGYGAFAGAGNSPDNRIGGAAGGAIAGAAGSLIGQGAAKGGAAVLRGVTSSAVRQMADQGVPMTVGQVAGQSGLPGKIVKGVEDRLSGFAGVGTMINNLRGEGYRTFNAKAFDKALEPIGGAVNGATGEEAVQVANQAVKGAFDDALKGKVLVPDQEFVTQARGPLERLAGNKRIGPEIVGSIEQATQGLFDPQTGALPGEHMQAFLDALRQIKQGYKTDPLYQTLIKPSLQGLENSVEGMASRQAPEVMPKFNAAKAAYRRLSILADAVNRAKNTEGTFTPGQLGMADRANSIKYDGKIAAASGDSPFFDYQRAAQAVLRNRVPDSGTAGRMALAVGTGSIPALGAGAGYLGGDTKTGAEAGIGLTGILALAYTKTGQRRLAAMLLSRNPAARALADKITARVPVAGAAGTALVQQNGGR